jgi:hypothetical protein
MIDVFDGKRLNELELADVEKLLDDAKAEPLHWEAKGIEIRPARCASRSAGSPTATTGGS